MAQGVPRQRRKLFQIFEGGVGKRPVGLFQKAARSEQRGLRRRVFVATDTQKVDVSETMRKAGLKKKPANLEIRQQDSIQAMAKLKPNSQDLIVESYLVNNIHQVRDPLTGKKEDGALAYIRLAKRALKPGGRMVLIQDLGSTEDYQAVALSMGLEFHLIRIPEKKAKKSPSAAVRSRSTVTRRQAHVLTHFMQDPRGIQWYSELMAKGIIREPQEFYIPTIVLLKKPLKEKTVKVLNARMVQTGLAGLSPKEQSIVHEILGE